jgi:hypothetical protein
MVVRSKDLRLVIEQRKNLRFDLKFPLEILARTNEIAWGETRNLSSSGVLFTSERSFEMGERIEYLVRFPKTRGSQVEVQLRCSGQVLRKEAEFTFAATLEHYRFLRSPSIGGRASRKATRAPLPPIGPIESIPDASGESNEILRLRLAWQFSAN